MELYNQEITDRRINFNKFTEVIHAKVNQLSKFNYLLVGFEKITQESKNISLSDFNLQVRTKAIRKSCSLFTNPNRQSLLGVHEQVKDVEERPQVSLRSGDD